MALEVEVKARQLGGDNAEQPVSFRTNEYRELLTAQGLPPYTEMTRRGGGFTVQTATLFAPLVAIPTTVAALELWNNSASGKDLIVDTLFADQVLSTAATQTYAIYACISIPKAVPSLTALALSSTSGRQVITPTVASDVVTGVGTTVIANGWRPWGVVQAWGTAAAIPGNSWHAEVNGRLIAPPGCSVLIHVMGTLATASSFQVGCGFYMAAIDTLQ